MKKKIPLSLFFLFLINFTLFSQEIFLSRYDSIISNRNSKEYNFYLACLQNNTEYIKSAISEGFDINCELTAEEDSKIGILLYNTLNEKGISAISEKDRDEFHCSALAAAVYMNSRDVIQLLLVNKAIVDRTMYNTGDSLLDITFKTGNYDTFTLLCKNGLNPFSVENSQLHEAIFSLKEKNDFQVFFVNNYERIEFTICSFDSYCELISREGELSTNQLLSLMKKNSSVEKVLLDKNNLNLLLEEFIYDNIEDTKSLLQAYPELKTMSFSKENMQDYLDMLSMANEDVFIYVFENMSGIRNSLLSKDFEDFMYLDIIINSSDSTRDYLFKNGLSINHKLKYKNEVLSLVEIAARYKSENNYHTYEYYTLLKYLTNNKAFVNTNDNSSNILFNALLSGSPSKIEYVIDKYGLINTKNEKGKDPLNFYLENNSEVNYSEIKLLINKTKYDEKIFVTCLNNLINKGIDLQYIKILIEHGLNINTITVNNNSYLYFILSRNSIRISDETLRYLISQYLLIDSSIIQAAIKADVKQEFIISLIDKCPVITKNTLLSLSIAYPDNQKIKDLILKNEIDNELNYRDLTLEKYKTGDLFRSVVRITNVEKSDGFYIMRANLIENGINTYNSIYFYSENKPNYSANDVFVSTMMLYQVRQKNSNVYAYFILIEPTKDLSFIDILLTAAKSNYYSITRKLNSKELLLIKEKISLLDRNQWYKNEILTLRVHSDGSCILYFIEGDNEIYVLPIDSSAVKTTTFGDYSKSRITKEGIEVNGFGSIKYVGDAIDLPF